MGSEGGAKSAVELGRRWEVFAGRPVLAASLLLLVLSCPPWDTGRGAGGFAQLGGQSKARSC